MIKSFKNWLSTPYYFNPSIKFKFRISFIHGLFIFLFLYIFKPFYLSEFDVIILEYTLGIGVIAFLGTFIVLYIPALIFKNYFNEDNWTIGKNLFLMAIGITFVSINLWYFGEMYKEPYNLRKISLLQFLFYTFLVSTIPLTFFVFINEKNIREKREKKVVEIKERKKEKELKKSKILNKEIVLFSDNGKEKISFHIDNLIYITSQGNYVSFFIQPKEELKEKILRATLARISKDLEDYTEIVRCHKSYIINKNYVTDFYGNARGYLLKSDIIPIDIPVSRTFSKKSLQSLLE